MVKSVKALVFFKKQNLFSQISRKKIKHAAGAVGNGAASRKGSGSDFAKKMQLLLYNTGKIIKK
jgi:hypothetical protein